MLDAIIFAAQIGFLGALFLVSAVMSFTAISLILWGGALLLAEAAGCTAYYINRLFRRIT